MRALAIGAVLAALAASSSASAQDDFRDPEDRHDAHEQELGRHDSEVGAEDVVHDPTGGTHAEDAASGHADHGIDWWAIAAAAINFALLIWILVRMGRKPLASFLVDRRATIESEIAEASRLKKEAEEKHREYESRLKALDQEINRLRQEMVDAGVAERDRIIADAQAKAERMRKDTQFLIDQQLKQLRIDLTREAVTAAVQAAGQELKQGTTAQDQERLARDYLARLGKGGRA